MWRLKKIFPYLNNTQLKLIDIDEEGLYSVTWYNQSQKIASEIQKLLGDNITIVESCLGWGADTIVFCKTFDHVISYEINDNHADSARNNLMVAGVNNFDIIRDSFVNSVIDADVLYMDPPWGGKNYKKKKSMSLYLDRINIADLYNNVKDRFKLIVIKIPKNFNLNFFRRITNASPIIYEFSHFDVMFLQPEINGN